jgi:putative ABC transport system permease protein
MKLAPLGDRRADVEADIADLYRDRHERYGAIHAYKRLLTDAISVWRGTSRGGSVVQDLRFGIRLIRKHPAPIAIAIGGLGLAIGMVTSMFSLVDVTLLRPYKMADPSSVVSVVGRDHHWSIWSYADFVSLREHASLTKLEATDSAHVRFGAAPDQDSADALNLQFVSSGYMQTLGGRAASGRSLGPSDDVPGAPPVVVVSRYFWTAHLGGDPAAIGRTLWINGKPITLVGVIDEHFVGPVKVPMPLWTTFANYEDVMGGREFTPATRSLVEVLGRLTPGVGMAAARDELSAIAASLPGAQSPAKTGPGQPAVLLYSAKSPSSGQDATDNLAAAAATLFVGGLVLVLACANAANLLLAGAVTRSREIGVRLALGATRWRLIRQLLSEGLLLSVVAGGVGFVMSIWFVPAMASLLQLPAGLDVSLDIRVFVFTTFIAILCGLGASVAPARFGARGHLNSHGHLADATPRSARLRTSFVAFQAGVSVLMLIVALLMTRTALVTTGRGPGYDVDKLLAVSVAAPRAGFDENAYFRSVVSVVRGIPSVAGVSVAQNAPFGHNVEIERFGIHNRAHALYVTRSDAGYFKTTGVRIVRGRSFTDAEINAEAPVAVIGESVAREFFRAQDPIGQSIDRIPSETGPEQPATIIGIASNAVSSDIHTADYGEIYRPIKAKRSNPPVLIIRADRPLVVARAIETTMQTVDPRVRVTTALVGPAAKEYFEGTRLRAILGVTIASVAFALSILGVYGVTAFVVSQRAQEVGVRVALGASARNIVIMLVRQSLRPVLIGLGGGLVTALLAGQLLATFLAGVTPRDPIAIAGATAALVAGAFAAVWSPARRATRVDPTIVLKEI